MEPAKRALKDRDDQLYLIAKMLGLSRYDSVRPCPRCDGKERYVSNRGCLICQMARASGLPAKKRRQHMAIEREEARSAGQRYYYPIHRCSRGHKSRWRVRDNVCMMCERKAASAELHWRLRRAEDEAARRERLEHGQMTDEQILRMADA